MSNRSRRFFTPKATLQVELLEDRNLLAATTVVSSSQLVAPPNTADPTIQIATVPNDPSFSGEWGLLNTGQGSGTANDDIHATQAWNVTTGSMKTVVAVIDTGIDYTNTDLAQNIWINQAEIPDFWYTKSSPTSGYNKIVYKSQIVTAIPGLITFRDLNAPVNAGLVWDNNGNGIIDAGDLLRPMSQGGWDSGSTKDGDTAHPDDFFGWNFVNNTNNPFDDNGHGTAVSGIIGASGNNGVGIAGVDWNVQLMAIKVMNSNGVGTASAAAAGLDYAVEHGAVISNNSYSTSTYDQGMYDAINNARAAGQIVVTAAGNGVNYQGINDDTNPAYPASYGLPNVVTVAATSNTDTLASFSNYGKATVALGAPGLNILSTMPKNALAFNTGTSMAAPFVTGVLALVESQHPTWKYYQVIDQVLDTTDPLPALNGKTTTGGILDAYKAVTQVVPDPGATIVSAAPNGTGAQPVSSVRITFSEGMTASTFTAADVLSLTGPKGAIPIVAVVPVYNTDDRQYDVEFAQQSAAGTYTLKLGNTVNDITGKPLNLTGYSTSFTIQGPLTFSNPSPVPIRDVSVNVSTLTVASDVNIGSIQVLINLTHTCDNDLLISLIGPDGTDVVLSDRRGGYGHNYTNTLFSDSATTPIGSASAPFTGTFMPEVPLSAFSGKDAKGTWTLVVQDCQAGDVGTINSWSLIVLPAAAPTSTATSSVSSGGTVKTSSIGEPIFETSAIETATVHASPTPPVTADASSVNESQVVGFTGGIQLTEPSTNTGLLAGEPRSFASPEPHPLDAVFSQKQDQQAPWITRITSEENVPVDDLLAYFEQDVPSTPSTLRLFRG
jgi:serine protease